MNQRGVVLVMSFLPLLLSVTVGGTTALGALQIHQRHQWHCRRTLLSVAAEGSETPLQKLREEFSAMGSFFQVQRDPGKSLTITWQTADHLGFSLQGQCSYLFTEGLLQ